MDDLGQIADLYRGAEAQLAAVGRLLPQQDLQQRRLAGAVVAQQGDALAADHLQVYVIKKRTPVKGLLQLLDGEHLVPAELALTELYIQPALLGGLVGGADTLDALLHGLGPLENLVVARVGPYPQLLGRLLQLLDLGLLLLVLLELFLVAPLLLHHIEAVVARIELRLAVVNLNDPLDHPIQKPAVVGDGQDGALVAIQILLQPLGGPEIQVVGRLVQQKDVGVLQNQAGQVDPGLLPAGERGKKLSPHVLGNLQAVAHLVQLRLGVIAASGLKRGGEGVVPPEKGGVAVRPHLLGKAEHLRLHGVELIKGGLEHVSHRILRRIDRDLGNKPYPLAGGYVHLALVPIQFAGEDFEQCGLAGAVFAQQAHPLPLVYLKGQAVQYLFAYLELLGQVRDGDINHLFTPVVRCDIVKDEIKEWRFSLWTPSDGKEIPFTCSTRPSSP